MKYSEKMQLLLKGVSLADIKQLEEQEAAEAAEAAENEAIEKEENEQKELSALEAAEAMVKELEEKLSDTEDKLAKANQEFAELANKQTVKDSPKEKYSSKDVMKELFHPVKKEA